MREYEPELGQAVYGQPYKQLRCPEYVADALEAIRWVLIFLSDSAENDPFANSGVHFECDTFEVHAYDWDPESTQKYNFKWGSVEVSWYKWLGRGMSINRQVTWDLIREMLIECTTVLLGEQT